jgi:glycosyltransferase involved in cell wall biosynthesis
MRWRRSRPTEVLSAAGQEGGFEDRGPRLAIIPAGDLFEDFYDKIDVSLEDFRLRQRGTWLFNFVDGLKEQGIRTVLFFVSNRVERTTRFVHIPSGAQVCVFPPPRVHIKLRNFAGRPKSNAKAWGSIASYLSLPLRSFARELRRSGCGAVICQEYESPRFDICVALGKVLRLPVLATYQGANSSSSHLEAIARRIALRECSGVIVGASAEIARLRAHYGLAGAKVAHIPNSVDVGIWRPGLREDMRDEMAFGPDTCVIAWHGRVQIERKGLDQLILAWPSLRTRTEDRDLRLLLIGSGRNRNLLRQMIDELPSPAEVTWIDHYIHDPVVLARYLCAADIYCLPSRHEGFSVAVLEAMACGLPVVATDVSGVSDVLGQDGGFGGIVIPPGSAESMADALASLVKDPGTRRALGAAARRRVEEGFTIDSVGRRLWDFLRARGVPVERVRG